MTSAKWPLQKRGDGRHQRSWKILLLVAGACLVAFTSVFHWVQQNASNSAKFRQQFTDTFDTSADLRNWTLYNASAPRSNPTLAWWSASHVTVGDGQLTIAGYRGTTSTGEERIVTGGAGLYKQAELYGKWVAKVRFNACPEVKYAVLLWPVSGDWPAAGEIDFAEDEGGNRTNTTGSVIRPNRFGGKIFSADSQTVRPATTMTQWHTVGVEWTPSSVRYTLDGHYWGTPVTAHLPKSPMAFVVQTEAVVAPSAANENLRCNAYVDYVTQYRYLG